MRDVGRISIDNKSVEPSLVRLSGESGALGLTGHGFDSAQGHVPRSPPVTGGWVPPSSVFLSVSLPLPSALSLKKKSVKAQNFKQFLEFWTRVLIWEGQTFWQGLRELEFFTFAVSNMLDREKCPRRRASWWSRPKIPVPFMGGGYTGDAHRTGHLKPPSSY